jgi:hypothetical protein
MHLVRASLAFSVWLAAPAVLAPACGGAVATIGGDDGGSTSSGSGSSGSSGGSSSGVSGSGSGVSGSSSGGASGSSSGGCQVDGVPCIAATQCCSGTCDNQVCGGPVTCLADGSTCSSGPQCCSGFCSHGACSGPTPTCVPDGGPCKVPADCCNGSCVANVCQGPTPPPVCVPSSNANLCDQCLAKGCCQQVVACESDPTCSKAQACFDGCYAGAGTGGSCAQKCNATFPSAAGNALFQCAAQSCLSVCQ